MKTTSIEMLATEVCQELESDFDRDSCETLARETQFIQRSTSRLTGNDFLNLLTVDTLGEPAISYIGLCDSLEERSGVAVSPQALCERVNSDGAVKFLQAVLAKVFRGASTVSLNAQAGTRLAPFGRVLLQDSTQIEVHETLSDAFKGSGGNASQAAVKIDYSYDVKHEQAEPIALRQGTDNDQSFAMDLAARLRPGDWVVRDLGYFCLSFFVLAAEAGAFFLSRLREGVNLYVSAEADAPLHLIQHINRFGNGAATMEFSLLLGEKQRLPVRLLAYRLPPEVYRTRQKAALKTAKRKGRRVKLSYLKFLKYAFFVTNVPATLWPPEAAGTIYRLRWRNWLSSTGSRCSVSTCCKGPAPNACAA